MIINLTSNKIRESWWVTSQQNNFVVTVGSSLKPDSSFIDLGNGREKVSRKRNSVNCSNLLNYWNNFFEYFGQLHLREYTTRSPTHSHPSVAKKHILQSLSSIACRASRKILKELIIKNMVVKGRWDKMQHCVIKCRSCWTNLIPNFLEKGNGNRTHVSGLQ